MANDIEVDRIAALRALGVLDTPPEAIFDHLTRLASASFDAPIALVSLVDTERQWFKSCIGLGVRETGRDVAFCEHAIRQDDVLVVLDATQDPRFRDNPLVKGEPRIRFYAGAPLVLRPGVRLGTLCVIDPRPRAEFSAGEREKLRAMAAAVTEALAMRRDISAFHAIDRERDERQRLLAKAESMAGVGHWSWARGSDATQWSPAVYAIHGLDPSRQTPGYDEVLALYHPEDRATLDAAVQSALATGAAYTLQLRVLRADGELRHVKASGEPQRDLDGQIIGLVGLVMDVSDVVRTDETIRTNEARLTFLTENSADIIMRIAPKRGVTWVSPNVRQFGYRPEQLLAKAAFEFIHPDDLPGFRSAQAALLAGEEDRPADLSRFRLRRDDGGWLSFEINGTIVRDGLGEPLEVINVLRDVTARCAAEAALAESEARFRLLAENATDIIACFGTDARFTYLSPSIKAVLGYDPEDLIGQPTRSIMHPDDHQASLETYRAHLASERARDPFFFEYRAVRKDGSMVWLAAHPRPIFDPATNELVGFNDVVRDVSKRRAVEAELAASEARFRLLAENATDLIMKSGIDGKIAYISPATLQLTGYRPDEIVGRTAQHWVHPDDWGTITEAFQDQVQSGGAAMPRLIEYRLLARDGRVIWMESAPRATVEASTGLVTSVTDVARDVTTRKQLQAELAAARDTAEAATAVKSDFMANMSHEIRTPLTAILGFTGLLAKRPELESESRSFVGRITTASDALLAIVNDVLDFSKLEAGLVELAPRPVGPQAMLQDALTLFEAQARAKGLNLRLVGDDTLPPILRFDPDRVRQVVLNLVGNAVKFTPEGEVRLVAVYDARRGALGVRVEDEGIGLSPEAQAKLFQRFSQVDGSSTRQHGGTGLGLAICKGLVEAMGGRIGVESLPGRGSTFHFEIPAPICSAIAAPTLEAAPSEISGLRVLVADDNPVNRELVRAILEPLGLEITEAADGSSAVEQAMAWPFDVLLMDIRMPRLDGSAAARLLRGRDGPNQSVPILAFSADADMSRLPNSGEFDGFVAKPLVAGDLIRAIVATLDLDVQRSPADAA